MEKDIKKGFKWRGLATFLLSMGMLIEMISGVVLYITPPGRYANWNNWTLWGLTKGEWGALHTIFGYVLLIIVGLHLYFNWRVVVHFFWSKVKNSFNLKKELAVSAALTILIFAGTLWGIPPFSTIMDWGEDAKHSWEANSGVASSRGNGRGGVSSHDTNNTNSAVTEQRGRGRGSSTSGWNADGTIAPNQAGGSYANSGRGQGRGGASQVAPQVDQVSFNGGGGGYGRKTIEMICSENNVAVETGLSRLGANGVTADARASVRDLANSTGKRPSEIVQIVTGVSGTSTHTEGVFNPNTSQSAEKLKGRDYVRLGKPGTVSGTLVQVGDEWGLKVTGNTYEIHMGPSDFRASQGFVLKDGAEAAVTGFIYGNNISVTVMETAGQKIVLRDETGRAAWSGSGFSKSEGSIKTF